MLVVFCLSKQGYNIVMFVTIVSTCFIFILGAIIGSFLNVVILRYNTGMGITGRSACFSCRAMIRWFENIPIISFVLLRGRCGACKTSLSIQYPIVEFVTATTFSAIWLFLINNHQPLITDWYQIGFSVLISAVFYFLVFSILIVIAVYDLRHTIIPNMLVYTFSTIALAGLVVRGAWNGIDILFWLDLMAGPMLFVPFWAIWYFSRGRWIGLGDGKMALGIGWLLGLVQGVSAIVFGFWAGAIYAVGVMSIQIIREYIFHNARTSKQLSLKSAVPFGPFLVIGTLLALLFRSDVFQIEIILSYLVM